MLIEPEGSECCYGLEAFRIAVQLDSVWIDLPFVALDPHQLRDGSLLLRAVESNQDITLRLYDAKSRRVRTVSPPADYFPGGTMPDIFPSRDLITYDVLWEPGESRVVVRQWPTWDLLVTGPPIARCDDTLLSPEFSEDGRFVRWYPPHCTPDTPAADSLAVPPIAGVPN